jgi:hypothetical protein
MAIRLDTRGQLSVKLCVIISSKSEIHVSVTNMLMKILNFLLHLLEITYQGLFIAYVLGFGTMP